MKQILLTLGLALLSLTARAADETQPTKLLNCWDGTYAYGTTVVETMPDQPTLLHVELASEEQLFLKDLAVSQPAGWGQGKVSVYLPAAACTPSPASSPIFTCAGKGNIVYVEYEESIESRRVLSIVVDEVTLKTSANGKTFTAEISFKRSGSQKVQKASLGFAQAGSSCRSWGS